VPKVSATHHSEWHRAPKKCHPVRRVWELNLVYLVGESTGPEVTCIKSYVGAAPGAGEKCLHCDTSDSFKNTQLSFPITAVRKSNFHNVIIIMQGSHVFAAYKSWHLHNVCVCIQLCPKCICTHTHINTEARRCPQHSLWTGWVLAIISLEIYFAVLTMSPADTQGLGVRIYESPFPCDSSGI
jgi:hypothetical protein